MFRERAKKELLNIDYCIGQISLCTDFLFYCACVVVFHLYYHCVMNKDVQNCR